MIKRFVLNYIRNHMSHTWANDRNDILRAVNQGCQEAFNEDTPAGRISWVVGELVKNDDQFIPQNAPIVMNAVASEMLHITANKVKEPPKSLI